MSTRTVIATQQNAAPAGRTVVVHAMGMAFYLDPRGS